VQLSSEVLSRLHWGMLTHTLPVPGPNTAAARNAVAPGRIIVNGVIWIWQGSIEASVKIYLVASI
jgi:hypothetical protein